MKNSSSYRQTAWNALGEGMWGRMVILSLICVVCVVLVSSFAAVFMTVNDSLAVLSSASAVGTAVNFLFVYPLLYAYSVVCLQLVRRQLTDNSPLQQTFANLKSNYSAFVGSFVIVFILILLVSLPTLLIGSIVLSFAYVLVPYIINDNPNIGILEALRTSRIMMRGHKWQLFCLELSFIGWLLLGIITLYIGFLWVIPYMQTAVAAFYEDVRKEYYGLSQENEVVDEIDDADEAEVVDDII